MATIKVIFFGVSVMGLLLGLAWNMTSRDAYEGAQYRVIVEEGAFELREYPELVLASTPMRFEGTPDDGSFMRLFRYISGDNEAKEKIAMTVPVFMDKEQAGEEGQDGRMGFVLPRKVAEAGAPEPQREDVQLKRRPAGTYAVRRFSGRLDRAASEKAEAELRQWIAKRGWEAVAGVEVAGYDPPWTPGPLRRNEVLIPLDSAP